MNKDHKVGCVLWLQAPGKVVTAPCLFVFGQTTYFQSQELTFRLNLTINDHIKAGLQVMTEFQIFLITCAYY